MNNNTATVPKFSLKTGDCFYTRSGEIIRWKKYRKGAAPEYLRLGGRWQRMNEYAGWKNFKYDPAKDPFKEWC